MHKIQNVEQIAEVAGADAHDYLKYNCKERNKEQEDKHKCEQKFKKNLYAIKMQ